MQKKSKMSFLSYLIQGIIAISFGIFMFAWPGMSVIIFILIFGVYLTMEGISGLGSGFALRKTDTKWWVYIIKGLVELVLAFIIFMNIGMTAVTLTYFVAIWAIVSGCYRVALAISDNYASNRLIGAVTGIIFAIIGIYLLINPSEGALALSKVISILLVVMGILQLVMAFKLRRKLKAK